ncbi:MAG: nuclear transport factor 2 family protein [Myxococcales bacterium]|nr:MAG: nuclear transport factor 2 family protein [Myxococcales bacterium]
MVALEKSLLTNEVRSDPSAVAALLDPHWREIGASGRVWSRDELLAEIGPIGQIGFDLIGTRSLADDTLLVLWRSRDERGSQLRSSIWQQSTSGHWLQVFHQGTPEH